MRPAGGTSHPTQRVKISRQDGLLHLVGYGLVASSRCVRAVAAPTPTDAVHTGPSMNESTDSSRPGPNCRKRVRPIFDTEQAAFSFQGAEQVYRAQEIPRTSRRKVSVVDSSAPDWLSRRMDRSPVPSMTRHVNSRSRARSGLKTSGMRMAVWMGSRSGGRNFFPRQGVFLYINWIR